MNFNFAHSLAWNCPDDILESLVHICGAGMDPQHARVTNDFLCLLHEQAGRQARVRQDSVV